MKYILLFLLTTAVFFQQLLSPAFAGVSRTSIQAHKFSNSFNRTNSLEILVASRNQAFPKIISNMEHTLNKFFSDNKWTNSASWGTRKAGALKTLVKDDVGIITIPGVSVFLALNDAKIKFHIGTIKIESSIAGPDKVAVNFELENVFNFGVVGGKNNLGQLKIGSKKISVIWDSALKTIVQHNLNLIDVGLVDLSNNRGSNNTGKIGQFIGEGNITKISNGHWTGKINHRAQDVSLFGALEFSSAEVKNEIDDVDFVKYTKAIRGEDGNGILGGWFYGGLITPQEFIKTAILGKDAVDILKALENASRIDKKGRGNVSINSLSSFGYRLRHFYFQDNFFSNNGKNGSKGHIKLVGISSSNPNSTRSIPHYLPTEINIPYSGTMSLVPEFYKALRDIEINNPGILTTIADGSGGAKSFLKLKPMLNALVATQSNLQLKNITVKNRDYEAHINGWLDVTDQSDAGFLSKLTFETSYYQSVFDNLKNVAEKSKNVLTKALVLQLGVTKEKSSSHDYRSQLIAEIGNDGQFRLNGNKIGEPIPTYFPTLSGALSKQHSRSSSAGGLSVKVQPVKKIGVRDRLLRLKKLESSGLITPAEAAEKREKILNDL